VKALQPFERIEGNNKFSRKISVNTVTGYGLRGLGLVPSADDKNSICIQIHIYAPHICTMCMINNTKRSG
jgi:hypothetical protein